MKPVAAAFLACLFWCSIPCFASSDPRAEVAAALKAMGDAANAHDVDRHVGFYAHDPQVTLIVDGEPIVGWDAIREKQRQWWNDGHTDVRYDTLRQPEVRVITDTVCVTTLLLKSNRTSGDGGVRESRFAVSSIWVKRPEGWRVIYSHESSSR